MRLLSAVAEELDYSRLTATYSRLGRIEYSPRLLFKVVLYGCTRGIYAIREIERACRENVNFMYLLEGHRAPDHNTIARFRRDHLPYAVEDLLNQMVRLLVRYSEISFEESAVFIDGTKIVAIANPVCKKAIETINDWLERLKRYNLDIHICSDRNSYSKTEPIDLYLEKILFKTFRQMER